MQTLRQLLLPSLTAQSAVSAAVQQVIPSASLLPPAVTQQLQWAFQLQQKCSTATARKLPTRHERNIANSLFCWERAAWKRQLKELRKQWRQEHQQRVSAYKASLELRQQQKQQLHELQDASKQVDKQKHDLERKIREAERAVEVAGLRVASAIRQELRQNTLQKFREERRQALIEDSRGWIPPEALEARIAEALDNPRPLGAAE